MLLWLTQYLSEYVSGFGVFQYLTLRTMVSVVDRTCRLPADWTAHDQLVDAVTNWSAGARRWTRVAF